KNLNPNINATDDMLIKTIAQICNSLVQSLNVPNRLYESAICHLLDVVQNKVMIKSSEPNNDKQQSSLLNASKFWSFLLNATDKSIKMGLLETLTESKNDELINYFNSGVGFDYEITNRMLDFLRKKLHEHLEIAEHLFSFYYQWCDKTNDFPIYLEDLTVKMESLKDISLDGFSSQDYYQKVYQYKNSQTFANMVKNNVKDEYLQSSVLNVAKIFSENVIGQYQKTYIPKEKVRNELEIMAGDAALYLLCQRQNDLVVSIEYLPLIPPCTAHLRCLLQVFNQFKVRDADKSWVTEIKKDLKDVDMKLDMLPSIFQKLNRYLNELNDDTWSVIKEINFANEFIKYLLENLIRNDLTNLINAVDDQLDTKLLQENTVAALIEVNKALNPLNKDSARLLATLFLICLSENMYRNIAKQGELILKYNTTQNQHNDSPHVVASYNIAELHDLCGRALLIEKSRAFTNHLVDDDGSEDISMLMNQFVIQVDLAQQITNIASRLIQYSHFLYQKLHEEAYGTLDLQHLSIDHTYNDENNDFCALNKEICQNFVRFVNDKAELPQSPNWTGKWPIVQSKNDFLPTLRKIGTVLHDIFTGIPRQNRTIPEPVISDTVFKGKIFVADCHSHSL
ncbi:7652_t:CDS:2, partial [Gigaspora margarita]